MKKNVLYSIVILSLLIVGIGGYVYVQGRNDDTTPNGTETSQTEETETGTEAEVANPAAVFCEDSGGTHEIEDQEGGQVGFCVFEDGSRCEEWAYYNGECLEGESLEEMPE